MSDRFDWGKLMRTISVTYQIETTITLNSLLYYLKKIPLIGKKIPGTLYGFTDAKKVISILRAVATGFSVLLKKAAYLIIMVCLPFFLIKSEATAGTLYQMSMNCLVFLSFYGGSLLGGIIFEKKIMKYVCIRTMRMSSQYYTLGGFFLKTIKDLAGFIITLPLLTAFYGQEPVDGIIAAVLLICFHLAGEALELFVFKVGKTVLRKKNWYMFFLVISCLLLAYLPLVIEMPVWPWQFLKTWPAVLLTSIIGAASLWYIYRYPLYTEVARVTVNAARQSIQNVETNLKTVAMADVQIKEKDTDAVYKGQYANLSGYTYLNQLFFNRHKRLLYYPAVRRVVIMAVVLIAACIAMYFFPEIKPMVHELKVTLPYFVFLMYLLTSNSSRVCKALFINCDSSLLHYGFYRQPQAILKNFRIRLFKLLTANLIISTSLALVITGLTLMAQTPWPIADRLLYLATVVMLGAFFSVHYLFLYYFFQPYTKDLVSKNMIYSLINGATYTLCLICASIDSTPAFFAPLVLAATIIYVLIALLLVYRFAPRNFRIK